MQAKKMNNKKSKGSKFKSHKGHHEGMDPLEHHRMMAQDFKKRFFITLPLTFITLALSPQVQDLLKYNLEFTGRNLVLVFLGSAIVFYGGKPFFSAAKNELQSKNWGMMTLVSLALSAGYLFSLISSVFIAAEPLWWEISTLATVFLLGHWLEMRAVVGTGGSLRKLAQLVPSKAHKIITKNGKEKIKDVNSRLLKKGDIVLIRPGENIPADGKVIKGISSVNESIITGESEPVKKSKGLEVIGGTTNNDGSLTIKVTKTGRETALAQIMELVRLAQNTKPDVQRLADRAAHWLTITAISVSTLTFIFWFFFSPEGLTFALTLAISVIVIACPHALGLAIPTVTTISTSLAAKNGILIRDIKGLEIARDLDYLVLDKTGTLTKGEFVVAGITKFAKVSKNEILKLAAAVENLSEHSIAKGIVRSSKNKKIEIVSASDFKAIPGKGAYAKVDGSQVTVGNAEMMAAKSITVEKGREEKTVVYVAKDKKLIGKIIMKDEIRDESKIAIKNLHKMGIKTVMLTGDKKEIAEKVANKLNINTVIAEVLPGDKVQKVKDLQEKGYLVGMVGDGVNDAAALTQADVGIAIGAGTSVAIESAEIVLVKSDPSDIVKTIVLSKKVNTKTKQNLAWASGYNILAIPAAAGLFIPWGIVLRPEWGAVLMSASSIIVVANAMLLKNTQLNFSDK